MVAPENNYVEACELIAAYAYVNDVGAIYGNGEVAAFPAVNDVSLWESGVYVYSAYCGNTYLLQ